MDEKETNRLEAFSDGVFAVAITLLVLDINLKPPGQALSEAAVLKALYEQLPNIFAFVTSFFTIGVMWLNHHRLFTHIKRTNTGLLVLNLLLLMVIVFIPVPTGLLAEYLFSSGIRVPALIYSATFFVMACCYYALWRYASHRKQLLGDKVDQSAVDAISRQYVIGPFLYAVAFGLAWLNTPASVLYQLILALFFALPAHLLRKASKEQRAVPPH
jgi:uncharacterized membrane protein